MRTRIVGALLVLALVVVAGCNTGGRFHMNDPYDRGSPVYYSAPATYASPCGG